MDRGGPHLIGLALRQAGPDVIGNRPQLGLGGPRRHPGGQPAHRQERVFIVHCLALGGPNHRHPELLFVVGGVGGGRHHPDHLVRGAVHPHRGADHVRIGAETPPPQPVAEHDHSVVARPVLAGQEGAAQARFQPEHVEEAGGDPGADHPLGVALASEVEARVLDRGEGLERPARPPPIGEVAGGDVAEELAAALAAPVRDLPDPDHAARIGKRQRPQDDRVDRREERGRDADPERQGEDGGNREAGVRAELAECEPNVLGEVGEACVAAHGAVPPASLGPAFVTVAVEVPEAAARLGSRLGGRVALGAERAGALGEVERDLLVDLLDQAAAGEEDMERPAHAGRQRHQAVSGLSAPSTLATAAA